MIEVNSAFWLRCQQDAVSMTDLIDLQLPNGAMYHWTTSDDRVLWTRSGNLTEYVPFPGQGGGGFSEDTKLGVQALDFVLANTGSALQNQLISQDFAQAKLWWGQVFVDTPDLGRNTIYFGKIGDFTYDRTQISGQARNLWKSLNIQWPPYAYNDVCALRFGGPVCGINPASFGVSIASINVSSSNVLAVIVKSGTLSGSFANGRFDFGRLTVTYGTNSGHVRPIMAHTGDLLQLPYPLPNSDLTSLQLTIAPGCKKRLIQDCRSLYNNDVNYMGFPWGVKEGDAW